MEMKEHRVIIAKQWKHHRQQPSLHKKSVLQVQELGPQRCAVHLESGLQMEKNTSLGDYKDPFISPHKTPQKSIVNICTTKRHKHVGLILG